MKPKLQKVLENLLKWKFKHILNDKKDELVIDNILDWYESTPEIDDIDINNFLDDGNGIFSLVEILKELEEEFKK